MLSSPAWQVLHTARDLEDHAGCHGDAGRSGWFASRVTRAAFGQGTWTGTLPWRSRIAAGDLPDQPPCCPALRATKPGTPDTDPTRLAKIIEKERFRPFHRPGPEISALVWTRLLIVPPPARGGRRSRTTAPGPARRACRWPRPDASRSRPDCCAASFVARV